MKFIIIGCGRMGAGLAVALSKCGHTITLIDKDSGAIERLDHPCREHAVLGTGFDRDILLKAGITHADGLAAVTNSDEANVIIARLARLVFHVPKAVARLVDPRKEDIYRRLGVQIVAPVYWAINLFVDLLSYSELDAMMTIGSGQVQIVQTDVPPLLIGRKVGAVAVPGEIHVVAVSRNGKTFIPSSETIFLKEDLMHIAVLTDSTEHLRTILALK
jgi:trk system potassium uptake protein TrkA